jgi:manganese/zinc/iron transport system permease protein
MLDDLLHVLFLKDYNTRLVVGSTALLGMTAGVIGSFLLLRKRSLMGDALSHATLPGICIAFLLVTLLGGEGKSLPGLLLGALVFGMIGVGCVILIRRTTRIKDDAAMGVVLSVFFGLGIALLGLIQDLPAGSAAGLESFIYGKTASMVWNDFLLIVAAAAAVLIASLLLFKELRLLCFDDEFAGAQGWPVGALDIAMLALVAIVTVIGLQAVGLILIIALLITPPAAARFWTDRLVVMIVLAALFGAAAGWIGSSWSALGGEDSDQNLPAGAMIVLVAAGLFALSMVFGGARGVLVRGLERWRVARRVARHHLLRAMYEIRERDAATLPPLHPVSMHSLLAERSWSKGQLKRALRRAEHDGLLMREGAHARLTARGLEAAERAVRNHRLWEMYLIAYADIAPSHVDRDADQIEHVLRPEMIERLEDLLMGAARAASMPESPHA